MPKSRKKKNQDFQKVKLKVGKKLPKGDNVTNLSFKTRQIQLTQRIKDDGGQDTVTKKKLVIQDLLRQCDHHSSSARVNAISGLKELWLNNYADLMVPTNVHGYAEILKKLATLLIDNEAIVRHSVINLFKLILTKLSSKTLEGTSSNRLEGRLYSHIHAYLCCAMNHVHEDIKLDALVLFDNLLDSFPHLMVQQTGDLLKNLVGLISSPAYLGTKGDSTTQRLSINPDSKLPAMKFRSQVLIRMKRAFMEALKDQTKNTSSTEYTRTCQEHSVWSLHRDHDGPNTKQSPCLTDLNFGGSRFSVMFQGGCHELDEYITKPSSLESFLKLSVPVLLQCWKEAHASVEQSDSDSMVSTDSVEVMSLVVCVIQLMFVLSSSHRSKDSSTVLLQEYIVPPEVLVQNFQHDFEKLLFSGFPFSVQIQRPQMKMKKKSKTFQFIAGSSAGQSSLVTLNLAICDIVSSFCTNHSFKPRSNYLNKMEAYLVKSVHKFPSMEHSKILIRIFKNVFSNVHINESFTKAYTAVLKHYLSCPVKIPQKRMFYNLFSYMTRTWDDWTRNGTDTQHICKYKNNSDVSEMLEDFIQNLPHLLMDVVTSRGDAGWMVDILTLMTDGYIQNCSRTFHDSFKSKLASILDPQEGVLTCAEENVQKRLFSLLSLGTPLHEDHLRLVLCLIRRPVDKPVLLRRKSCSIVSYAIFSITSCIRKHVPLTRQDKFNNMTLDQRTQLSDYLRFMFSLQIGMTCEELEATNPLEATHEGSDRWFNVDFTVATDQWDRHMEIACLVARELANFYIPAMPSKGYHQTFTFCDNLADLWKQTFMGRSKVHILSAYSLIQFFCQVSLSHIIEKPGRDFYLLASQIVASVLTGIKCENDLQPAPSEQMMWQIKSDLLRCLSHDATLLGLVMQLLTARSKDSPSLTEREAAKAAEYFLLLDEGIQQKLVTQQTGTHSSKDSS